MNRSLLTATLILAACTAIAVGLHIEFKRVRSKPDAGSSPPTDNSQAAQAPLRCDAKGPNAQWFPFQTLDYQPAKTLYIADWQLCVTDLPDQRVRIMDANFKKVFYEYKDDQILRVEKVELQGGSAPQLLIVTASSGTDDRVSWHVLSGIKGQLQEWVWPGYEALAEKLLRADEDFCCKEWNLHLHDRDIALARGIYLKDEDGNCCPSRGGVLVRLKPVQDGFKLVSVQRISRQEYESWRSQPFCSHCTLIGP